MEKGKKTARNRKINVYKILTILLSVALLVVVGVMAYSWMVTRQAQAEYDRLAEKVNQLQDKLDDNRIMMPEETQTETMETSESMIPEEETESTREDSLAQLGVDPPLKNLEWEALKQVNPDIYAWICIPGTQVDYPILQHPSDDSYYLKYNMNGTRGYPGCIYTEKLNEKDFTDFNTVIYGHNMRNQTMFASLHDFEEGDFFANNPYIYVYTKDEVLVYEIFAAWLADDAHILKNNDFSTEQGRAAYLTDILKNYSSSGNMRNDLEVTTDSHILTLSTCMKRKPHNRFLVQAVLLNEDAL
ncbi:MAG: class B sortase [Lachnospiraceae bacterium]|nr:class B sortase [Lachnospiraceae bacterium]